MDRFFIGLILGAMLMFILTRMAEFLTMLLPWKRAFMSGAKVTLFSIVGMHMRGCPPAFLVDAYCALAHAGHDITIQQVESCYIANKHKVSENNVDAFLDMVKDFAEKHPADPDSTSA